MNSDRKPSCRTNVLILFNKNLKNKTKLIKENSIPPWLAGPLEHVHMENFHLTYVGSWQNQAKFHLDGLADFSYEHTVFL